MENKIKKAIAKENDVNLLTHNRNVSIGSVYILNEILGNKDEELTKIVKFSGLLHDIGKITDHFQGILKGKVKPKNNNKFRHNEIGWAFLHTHLKIDDNIKQYIVNCVYWHHGISNKMSKHLSDEILNSEIITNDNLKLLKEFLIELIGEEYLHYNEGDITTTPKLYKDFESLNDIYNEKFILIRSCVISADRIISKLEEHKKDFNLTIDFKLFVEKVNTYLGSDKIGMDLNNFPYNDVTRFNNQMEIINNTNKTTIVKAPAGYGKTLIGLLWKKNKKMLWVSPKNVIAKNNYDSIIKELKLFNIKNIKVELFIGGEVIDKNHDDPIEFNSDIIVTNIDNFELPTIKNNIAERLFMILGADVVFDEYHEFASLFPLFSNFINIMRVRNRYCSSNTLLLSATPININYFWDSINNNTTILPNIHEHYPAIHNKKYLINVLYSFAYKNKGSDIIICNSIHESQKMKNNIDSKLLYHSNFNKPDKDNRYNYLINTHGKYSKQTTNKPTIISSLITQSSFDISFNKLYESLLSPETSIQRLGRCGRFGEFDNCEYTLFKIKSKNTISKSEKNVIEIFYDVKLSNLWFDEMEKYDGKYLTLNEIYEIYNKHVRKYEKLRIHLYNKLYKMSLNSLSNIYPYMHKNEQNNDILIAGGNKLRSNGNEIFYIVKHWSDDYYVGPFTTTIYQSFTKDFKEDDEAKTLRKIKNTIKHISNDKFDYSEIVKNKYRFKNIKLEQLRLMAKKSNTPYIRFDKVYHPTYGVININLFKNFN